MNKLSIGQEVYIRIYIGDNTNEISTAIPTTELLKGIVKDNSSETGNLSYHGSPWYETIYTVLGDDGETYIGTYGSDYISRGYGKHIYFVTKKEIVHRTMSDIGSNFKEICNCDQRILTLLATLSVVYGEDVEFMKSLFKTHIKLNEILLNDPEKLSYALDNPFVSHAIKTDIRLINKRLDRILRTLGKEGIYEIWTYCEKSR